MHSTDINQVKSIWCSKLFSRKSDSRSTNVCPSVRPSSKPPNSIKSIIPPNQHPPHHSHHHTQHHTQHQTQHHTHTTSYTTSYTTSCKPSPFIHAFTTPPPSSSFDWATFKLFSLFFSKIWTHFHFNWRCWLLHKQSVSGLFQKILFLLHDTECAKWLSVLCFPIFHQQWAAGVIQIKRKCGTFFLHFCERCIRFNALLPKK